MAMPRRFRRKPRQLPIVRATGVWQRRWCDMPLDRRQTLSLLGGLAAAMPVMSRAMTAPRRILVVGAGMAGLTAAQDLTQAGHTVTVIEGRERTGGRLHSSRLWPDAVVDLGASWIHGTKGNPVTALAQRAGATTVTTRYEPSQMIIDPALAALGVKDAGDAWSRKQVERAMAWAEGLDEDVSLRAALDAVAPPAGLSPMREAQLRYYLAGNFEQDYAGSIDRLSAWSTDDDLEFAGHDALLRGGYDQLAQYLAQGLTIKLGHVVRRIDWGSDGVQVTCANGDRFDADQVIVTVPLGVLKSGSIDFFPALPQPKTTAIERLGMGLLNKLFLGFDRVFWSREVDWIEFLKPEPGQWSLWVSYAKPMGMPVLQGFTGADTAAAVEGWDDRAIVTDAMDALRRMFGSRIPDPVAFQLTRWSRDPFALGSYSFNAVGSSSADRSALAAPEAAGRLIFAGEACSAEYPGTVHGALLSGQAAARVVLKG